MRVRAQCCAMASRILELVSSSSLRGLGGLVPFEALLVRVCTQVQGSVTEGQETADTA